MRCVDYMMKAEERSYPHVLALVLKQQQGVLV